MLEPEDIEAIALRLADRMRDAYARPEIMTPEEVAEELRVDREWVYRKARDGKIPAFKVGKFWRIRREDFERWTEEQRASTVAAS